jgi:hypothetical protein
VKVLGTAGHPIKPIKIKIVAMKIMKIKKASLSRSSSSLWKQLVSSIEERRERESNK